MLLLLLLVALLAIANVAYGDDNTHTYTSDEAVSLWVNTIGPFHNPTEMYAYYDLPYCHPDHGIERHKRPAGMGEILEGYELRNSGVKMHFATDVDNEVVCEMKLDADSSEHFSKAVDQQYWYELVVDDLPMWGMVGEVLESKDGSSTGTEKHIFTHRTLSISYNGDQIIEVNLTSENPVPIAVGASLQFTYTVKWTKTEKLFDGRFDRYLEDEFFEHKVHWFSIFNSFMMVIFLCGLVAVILLRTLRNDFARYAKEDELDIEGMHGMKDDSGWKNVYGDVFRAPDNLVLFSAMIGTGWQLLILILAVILYAMAGPILHGNMYEDRGEMVSTIIVCFALSSAFAGYSSGSFYRQYFPTAREEKHSQWQKTMIATILLFPAIISVVGMVLNMIAVHYETIGALPISVILKMAAIWLFVALPLSVGGTIFGRHWAGKNDVPCRVNNIPRPIPPSPWYATPVFVIPAAGILPFGSIFIEMYFMFTSFWSYKFYYVYGFMLLVYIILVLVTICTTIVAVYFVLSSENYHWQWLSFISAGSTSFYVFLYSIFYFMYKTKMTGFLQISFYFGYMALFCTGLFFMTGTVGVWGANWFVRKIYGSVKID
jgi:transmembrane 9 superfamily member 3